MAAKTYRALLVANSDYPADRNLAALEGPRNDAALLRDALCDDDTGLVPSDNIRLVQEREAAEIRKEIEDFFLSATPEDLLVLYYSGHGALNFKNELFFCARDTKLDRLRTTSVPSSEVKQIIEDSCATSTVVLLDCCHSGRFKNAPSGLALAGVGTFVVTSSRPGELADDTERSNSASRFTHHLVQALRSGADDEDDDGLVTVHDVYKFVHREMSILRGPVPQRHFSGHGIIPLARRIRSTVEAAVTPMLERPDLDIPYPHVVVGPVEPGVDLPVERVAVVNRGGGNLDWTCESACDWVHAERDGNELALHLSSCPPGKHLANVYVRDVTNGIVKTVRVKVEVTELVPAPRAWPDDVFDPEVDPLEDTAVIPGQPDDGRFEAGWYADPTGKRQYRYYDGDAWTDDVARDGTIVQDPIHHAPPEQTDWRGIAERVGLTGLLGTGSQVRSFVDPAAGADRSDRSDEADFEPGWYADPLGRHHYRYYDGTAWTDDAATDGAIVHDPIHR